MNAQWQPPGYELEELVGFGGSGEVWRARELISGDVVALKRLRTGDGLARERLRREAAVLSSVAGEHVVRVRDVVLTEHEAVLVMDFAAGGNLAAVLAVRGVLAAPEVVTLVGPLAAALADAHGRGIVHGDVTPANIVFTADGRPLLTDFGVARVIGDVSDVVEATPSFAAPEVLTGEPAAAAADVYALCKVADAALDRASAPPALCAAIDAGLAADPHERPTGRELAMNVLRSCAAAPVRLVRVVTPPPAAPTQPVWARPAPAAEEPAPETLRRRRRVPKGLVPQRRVPQRLVVATVVVAATVMAVAGGVMWGHRTQSSAAVLAPAPTRLRPMASPTTPPTTRPVVLPVWRDVVTRYDALRVQAFVRRDPQLLRTVYTPDSAALAVDTATVRALQVHDWHVQDFAITTQHVAPEVVTTQAATVVVTDTISAYSVVDGTGRVVATVPARRARTFAMQLALDGGSWRIASVSR